MLINTGNISRKVLSKVLRSFVKNFERLHATTDCYEKCDEVEAEVNLQRLEGSTWAYVTSRDKIRKNVGSVTVSDTITVKSGYYYRVVSFHSATKNGKTEVGSASSHSLYIG